MKQLLFSAALVVFASVGIAQTALDLLDEELAQEIIDEIQAGGDVEVTTVLGKMTDRGFGTLRVLDRLNGTFEDEYFAVGETVDVGKISITMEACRVPKGAADSDAMALITVKDERPEIEDFHAWILASSPALNALDHPRYDVWVLSCSESRPEIPDTVYEDGIADRLPESIIAPPRRSE